MGSKSFNYSYTAATRALHIEAPMCATFLCMHRFLPIPRTIQILQYVVHMLGQVLQAMRPLLQWNGWRTQRAFVAYVVQPGLPSSAVGRVCAAGGIACLRTFSNRFRRAALLAVRQLALHKRDAGRLKTPDSQRACSP